MNRLLMRAVLLATLSMMLVAPAAAQEYPPSSDDDVEASTSSPIAGDDVAIESSGWEDDSTVEIWLFSTPRKLATMTVDESGTLSAAVAIPADVEPGDHTLRLVGTGVDGQARTLEMPLTVTAVPVAVATSVVSDELIDSGFDARVGTLGLLALALLGAAAFVIGRKRAAASVSASATGLEAAAPAPARTP